MEKILKLKSNEEAIAIYGSLDENLRFAEKEYHVRISARNHQLKISGSKKNVDLTHKFFTERLKEIRNQNGNGHATNGDVSGKRNGKKHVAKSSENGKGDEEVGQGPITFFYRGKIIRPRTKNQERYLDSIYTKDVVFGIGPAGTGKTFLAVACAIDHLQKGLISKIVLTRPAVEAGENLGFLPGDLQAKVNPYLRPLYDALYTMMEPDEVNRYLETSVIEIAPLAYMRGRTLNDCFIILDEAQNSTPAQMKMFLTRLGESSKAVITGDITQIDLPGGGKRSGLVEAKQILSSVKNLQFIQLRESDVVRHPLVRDIIKAYDKHEHKKSKLS